MTATPLWMPGAERRPLSATQTEPLITCDLLIYHTMAGYLASTERMFRQDGYGGTESTFGVGGPWDGPELDGVIWQWQDTRHSADAQYEGNEDPGSAWSVETSDGGHPEREWSAKQLRSLVNIGIFWCHATGNEPVLARSPEGPGIGYHSLFAEWNKKHHGCPGKVRTEQLITIVIPRIKAAVDKPPATVPPVYTLRRTVVRGMTGNDVRMVQKLVGAAVDGTFGPVTLDAVRRWQTRHHLLGDGKFGPMSAKVAGWNYRER